MSSTGYELLKCWDTGGGAVLPWLRSRGAGVEGRVFTCTLSQGRHLSWLIVTAPVCFYRSRHVLSFSCKRSSQNNQNTGTAWPDVRSSANLMSWCQEVSLVSYILMSQVSVARRYWQQNWLLETLSSDSKQCLLIRPPVLPIIAQQYAVIK